MKKILLCGVVIFIVSYLSAAVSIEGSYTSQWNASPLTFKGTLNSKGGSDYEGDIIAPWKGKDEVYRGTLTLNGNAITGVFVLQSQKRTFKFAGDMSGGGFKGKATENGGNVGDLDMRISGAGGGGAGGYDWAALVSGAVSKNTGVSEEKVAALFEQKGSNKDDIISVCAVFEVNGGDMEELYKKKKKVNTNYEFLRDLKLEKEVKKKVDDLIKKIKDEVEVEKRKKK